MTVPVQPLPRRVVAGTGSPSSAATSPRARPAMASARARSSSSLRGGGTRRKSAIRFEPSHIEGEAAGGFEHLVHAGVIGTHDELEGAGTGGFVAARSAFAQNCGAGGGELRARGDQVSDVPIRRIRRGKRDPRHRRGGSRRRRASAGVSAPRPRREDGRATWSARGVAADQLDTARIADGRGSDRERLEQRIGLRLQREGRGSPTAVSPPARRDG